MRNALMITLTMVAVAGVIALVGCGEKQETELQGAPSANAPGATAPSGTHMMPGGQMMTDEQMKGMETRKADPATGATTATGEMASCPVLGTTMSKDKMIPYEYKGKTYYFCCPPCVEKFKKNPEQYINNPATPKPAGQGMGE
ncbi:MAG: YHS domain-containing protein [Armatimonadota bacterium]